MARTSTINIRRTSRGTTIRATGSAAQALCDAITHSAERVQAETKVSPIRLQVVVHDRNNTYEATALPSEAATAAGLKGVKATCTSGRAQAIGAVLAKATPPLHVARLVEQHVGPGRSDTYTIEAEVT